MHQIETGSATSQAIASVLSSSSLREIPPDYALRDNAVRIVRIQLDGLRELHSLGEVSRGFHTLPLNEPQDAPVVERLDSLGLEPDRLGEVLNRSVEFLGLPLT